MVAPTQALPLLPANLALPLQCAWAPPFPSPLPGVPVPSSGQAPPWNVFSCISADVPPPPQWQGGGQAGRGSAVWASAAMTVAEVCPIALPPQCLPLQYLEPAPNTSGSLRSPGLPFKAFLRYRCPLPCHFLLWGKLLRLPLLPSPLFLTPSSLLSFPTCCFPPLNHFPLPRHFPASPALAFPHLSSQ